MKIIKKITTLAAVLTSLVAWSATAQNLVTNGGFEDPDLGSDWAPYAAGDTSLTGWTVGGGGVQHFSTAIFSAFPDQSCQMVGGTDWAVPATISQAIDTIPGASYIISLDLAGRAGNGEIIVDFADKSSNFPAPKPGGGMSNVSFTATATESAQATAQATAEQ